MKRKCGYPIPTNLRIFKSQFDYFNGIGKFSQKECVDRSLLISGVTFVDESDYDDYIKSNKLENIL